MSRWEEVIKEVREISYQIGDRTFFRGQGNEAWDLRPSLARCRSSAQFTHVISDKRGIKISYQQIIENSIYYQLRARGGHLLPRNPAPWEVLFLMRHHTFPTRLLDWTTSFAIALFFALADADEDKDKDSAVSAAVWLLN